jgi:hypothetical protein
MFYFFITRPQIIAVPLRPYAPGLFGGDKITGQRGKKNLPV